MPHDTRRLLRVAGAILWITSGAPTLLLFSKYAGGLDVTGVGTWLGGYLVFGLAFLRVTSVLDPTRRDPTVLALLVILTGAALVMFHVVCTGFEAALLVLVAALLGMSVPVTWAVPWIVGETAVMGCLGTRHWSLDHSIGFAASALGLQVVAFLIAGFAANEARARHALAAANAELRAARSLLAYSSRAAERARISRDLHDVIGHHLTGLSLHLEVATHVAGDGAREPLGKAQEAAKQLLHRVRGVVNALRDQSTLDVGVALRDLFADIQRPAIHLEVPPALRIENVPLADALIHSVQEIVTNAIRHARAKNVWIEVAVGADELTLKAHDDGGATAPVVVGNGLRGMRERIEGMGGRLELGVRQGGGFCVAATLPNASEGA